MVYTRFIFTSIEESPLICVPDSLLAAGQALGRAKLPFRFFRTLFFLFSLYRWKFGSLSAADDSFRQRGEREEIPEVGKYVILKARPGCSSRLTRIGIERDTVIRRLRAQQNHPALLYLNVSSSPWSSSAAPTKYFFSVRNKIEYASFRQFHFCQRVFLEIYSAWKIGHEDPSYFGPVRISLFIKKMLLESGYHSLRVSLDNVCLG